MSAALFHPAMFVLAALCALLAVYGAVLFAFGQWSRHWPATIGTIESATLKSARIANGPGVYWVAAEYAYRFRHARSGSWIGFAHPGTASNPKCHRSTAGKLQAELLPGSRVDVFVCPSWPSISALRQGPSFAALGYVGLGLLTCGSFLWVASHV